jgi:hypothetical protein
VWFILNKPPIILGAWGVHILCDVFTHTPAYFPTPLFWPLSSWTYQYGISWATPVFMAINYGALAILYVLIAVHVWRSKKRVAA